MVHDLQEQIASQVALSPDGSKRVRIFEIDKDGRRQKEFTGTEMLGNLHDVDMYAEVGRMLSKISPVYSPEPRGDSQEIPLEEMEARDTDKIVDVFHFTKEPSRTHGVPFRFVVLPEEKFSDTKKRLQARMGIPDGGMTKYRFALVQMAQFKQPSYIADGMSVVCRTLSECSIHHCYLNRGYNI
jgi:ubiquitin carboxyl-terminal hydrolase 7